MDATIRFDDLKALLNHLGFALRIKGDHHIFTHNDIEEILNLQPKKAMSKAYQVKQVRDILAKYKMGIDDEQV